MELLKAGKLWTVQKLQEICKNVDPDVMFLSETKKTSTLWWQKNSKKLGFINLKIVPPHGVAGGGLVILLKDWLHLDIISSYNNYFDTKLSYEGNVSYVTFVYGQGRI